MATPDAHRIAPPDMTGERQEPAATRSLAVLLPCYNEAAAIAEVVTGFRAALPDSTVYVYDNNSTDQTASRAAEAGAVVRREPVQGKGAVVRRMLADVEAEVYLMADGDGTYDPASARGMIDLLLSENLDMVVGVRCGGDEAYRPGHKFGNALFNKVLALLFKSDFGDIFSGYRVFSRRFVKSFPAMTRGFDIETELSLHALELNLPVAEVETTYAARPEGSASKLRSVPDGLLILRTMIYLFQEMRPFAFFGLIALALAALSLALAYPIYATYLETGLVPRFPTAILTTGIMLLAFQSLTCGFILDSVSRGRKEAKRMRYLAVRSFTEPR